MKGDLLGPIQKLNVLSWYAGQKIKRGILRVFNLALNDPKAWDWTLWNLRGSQSLSGETVTEETALTYSAVWNAITLISGTIGSLPLHLMRPDGRNQKQATDHKLYDVLHTRYNPYMTAMAGRECLAAHILAWGNGYAEVVRNGYGEVAELWPIPPSRVKPKMQEGELVYEIKVPGEDTVTLPRAKILHIPGIGFDGFMGYSVVAMARKSIGLGMAMETFGSHFFGQGTHPGVIVSHPNQLSADAHANLKKALTDTYSGLGQSHRLMLLQEGMKIEKVTISPEDSQFLESRQFQIPEIARWFNLPPHKLKDLTKSSFNNIESEQASFVTDSILPWVIRFEQNYAMQLLSERERREGYYFKHVLEGLLRANAADRAEFYSKLFNIGVFSVNDIRQREDLNPVDGGDIHLVPLNMTTLDQAGQPQKEASPTPSEAPPETEENRKQNVLKLLPEHILNRKKENVDWKKLYEEGNAHWADDMQPSIFAQDFAQELVDKGKNSILEVGCGGGRDSILFALAGLNVTAIDFVPEAIEIAKENAENADVKIDFQVGNAEKLQFNDKSFDAIFTLSVLHSTNMEKSIPEVNRVLKRKGIAFIHVYSNVERIDGTKAEFISVDEYIDLVKKHDFRVLDIYTNIEDEFDEAGEKHLIIVSRVEKWKKEAGQNATVDISVKQRNASTGLLTAVNYAK